MRNSNLGIGVLHVKRQILTIFCDVISLLAQICIVSFDRAYSLQKNIDNFLWLSFCDNVPSMWPWPFTYEGQFFIWIDYDPISVLYTFQIDICTNSREIKYRNMGIGLLHVKRNTRQKWR